MWNMLGGLGIFGLLVLGVACAAVVLFVVGFKKRKPSWIPLILGAVGLVLGVVGTVVTRSVAMARVGMLGGCANPYDVAKASDAGAAQSLVGVLALALGVTFTVVLHRYFGAKTGTIKRRRLGRD